MMTNSIATSMSESLHSRIDSELLSELASYLETSVEDLTVTDALVFDSQTSIKFRQAKYTLSQLDQKEALALILIIGRLQVAAITSDKVIKSSSFTSFDEEDPLKFLRKAVTHGAELGKTVSYFLISTKSDVNSAIKSSETRGFKAARKRFAAMLSNNIEGTVSFDQQPEQIVADLIDIGLPRTVTFSSCDYSLNMFQKDGSSLTLEYHPRDDGEVIKFTCKSYRDRVIIQ